jgi:phosphoadenosine phosphosulfate reductase
MVVPVEEAAVKVTWAGYPPKHIRPLFEAIMEYTIIKEASEYMEGLAQKHPACLVAFSGGKDSLAILDLACRHFKKVTPFFMFLIPGLRCIEEKMTIVKERWGLDILHYPHFLLFNAFNRSIYCKKSFRMDKNLQEFGLTDIYKCVISDTGVNLIFNGSKETDSLWRRQKYFKFMTFENVFYPLKSWRKNDVLAYLKINNIPLPSSSGHQSTGIDLSAPSLLWLHDKYPDDFERLEAYFPFIGAVVKRREWYGIK